ncbi:hypothetical protein ACFX14_000406 [Malus domestica]
MIADWGYDVDICIIGSFPLGSVNTTRALQLLHRTIGPPFPSSLESDMDSTMVGPESSVGGALESRLEALLPNVLY